MLGAVNHRARHHAVLEHAAVGVDIAQEHIERTNALLETAVDPFPFLGRHEPRQEVGRDNPFGSLLVAIDGECDSLLQERLLASLLAADQLFLRQGRESAMQGCAMIANFSVGGKHLVIGRTKLVIRIGLVAAKPNGRNRQHHPIGRPHVFGMRQRFMLHKRSVRATDGGSSRRDPHFGQKERRMRGAHAPSSSRPCTKAGGYSAKGPRVMRNYATSLIVWHQIST